ncbi:MAG: tetratricopeptide repeat protein [Bacteroidales bacterium]
MPQIVTLLLFLLTINSVSAQRLNEDYYRAQAAMDNNDIDNAISFIDSAIAENPRNYLFWLKKGEAYLINQKYNEALSCFEEAENFRNGIASYWLARTYATMNDPSNALKELERHLSRIPRESEATILLDTTFKRLKNTDEWKEFWLNDWYTPNERFLAEVDYHFSRNEWNYALELLNERLDGKKGRHNLYALRGEAFYNMGSYKAAEADFKQALKRNRRNFNYMAWRARALMQIGRERRALKLINKAIEQSGGKPSYFLHRAQIFGNIDNYGEAVDDLKHYLSFYPRNIDAVTLYANYLIKAGKHIEALFQLGKLIKAHPEKPTYYQLRANVYMQSSNWNVAEQDINKALELGESTAALYLQRGICRQHLSRIKEACSDWQQAVKLGSFKAQELIYKYCK